MTTHFYDNIFNLLPNADASTEAERTCVGMSRLALRAWSEETRTGVVLVVGRL